MTAEQQDAIFAELRAAAAALIARAETLPPDGDGGAWPADEWGAAFATARMLARPVPADEAVLASFGMQTLVARQALLADRDRAGRARLRLLGATAAELRAQQRSGTALALAALVAEQSGEGEAATLLPFFTALEALMSCGLAASMGADGRGVVPLYWRLALEAARAAMYGPALLLCGGLSGSGKTVVAHGVAAMLGARVVVADAERKELLALPLTARTPPENHDAVYSVATSDRVYARLLQVAEAELAAGRPVILDATYLTRARRQPALELAARRGVPALILWCSVDAEQAAQRLARRAADAWTISDADMAVRAAQQAGLEAPSNEERGAPVLTINTAEPLPSLFDALLPAVTRHLSPIPFPEREGGHPRGDRG